jgi:hypothetical protein
MQRGTKTQKSMKVTFMTSSGGVRRFGPLSLFFYSLCVLCASVVSSPAAEPCQSGLKPGQKPGPYTAVAATGKDRGQSYCYICETGDRPAVVVFARTLTEPLGKLVGKIDSALADPKNAELRAWVTFLSADQPAFDPKVVDWAKVNSIRRTPLAVFEDADGPISYRLSPEADVTVVLFVKQKVVANFAFRGGELTEDRVEEVVKAVGKLQP